jgi:hypothetical protein
MLTTTPCTTPTVRSLGDGGVGNATIRLTDPETWSSAVPPTVLRCISAGLRHVVPLLAASGQMTPV